MALWTLVQTCFGRPSE
uniref:Uncharacterized protein n=1 Tax=Rhizophora mucronata TaxID=61149 RepID=A0A2P2K3T0_RHIMU